MAAKHTMPPTPITSSVVLKRNGKIAVGNYLVGRWTQLQTGVYRARLSVGGRKAVLDWYSRPALRDAIRAWLNDA